MVRKKSVSNLAAIIVQLHRLQASLKESKDIIVSGDLILKAKPSYIITFFIYQCIKTQMFSRKENLAISSATWLASLRQN
jgi:hypothetical protein